jgi:negative regulator of sigma-B (phosphoserine phosphatase)
MIQWGVAARPLPGQSVSGDLHVICERDDGAVVAAIDGLGHGPEAAEASQVAAQVIADRGGAPPDVLIEACHEALRRTRGAVMSVACLRAEDASLSWAGVGNVECLLLRANGGRDGITARGGIVGQRLPRLHVRQVPVWPGDTIVMATDGIASGFGDGRALDDAPQEVADRILARYAKEIDDALVVVARYDGPGAAGETIVRVREESDVAIARIRARECALDHGLGETATEALATAVSEVARNLLVHAGGGEISIRGARDGDRRGVAVIAVDSGPGVADVDRALEGGFSSGGGLGLGLSGARRLVDELEITSVRGRGTTVVLRKWGKP